MKSNYEDVAEFLTKYGIEIPTELCPLPIDVVEFRSCFMVEELTEYAVAYENDDLDNMIDSLIDLSYILMGTAHLHGYSDWDAQDADRYFNGIYDMDKIEPHKLPSNIILDCAARISALIATYANVLGSSDSIKSVQSAIICLHVAHALSRSLAILHGFNWTNHWNEVHKCNMTKERVIDADDPRSKRKHSLDVVKPEGWIGPNHLPIYTMKLANLQEKH